MNRTEPNPRQHLGPIFFGVGFGALSILFSQVAVGQHPGPGFGGRQGCIWHDPNSPVTGPIVPPPFRWPAPTPRGWLIQGRVYAWATPGTLPPGGRPPEVLPLSEAIIFGHTETGTYRALTDIHGAYSFWADSQTGTATGDFNSEILTVGSAMPGSGTETICNGRPCYEIFRLTRDWSKDLVLGTTAQGLTEYSQGAANAYLHTMAVNRYVKAVDPNWNFPPNLFALTNSPHAQFCNAVYDPFINQMSFWAASRNCKTNTSYASIVRHEAGHAFVMTLPVSKDPGNGDDYDAFHEGVADTLAALSLDDPCLGRNLDGIGEDKCYRDADNDSVYPVEGGTPHDRGMPVAGAFWDLQADLKSTLGDWGKVASRELFVRSMMLNESGLNHTILENVLIVDREVFHGQFRDRIRRHFNRHGFFWN